jgi:hypothetical protein
VEGDVGRRPERDDSAAPIEREDGVGQRHRGLHPMLDDDHGMRAVSHDRRKPGEDRLHARWIEVCRRLVEDEEAGERRQHVGDREPLLLAAGQPDRRAALEAGEPDESQRLGHPHPHVVVRPTAVLEPERDLVLDARHDELRFRVLEDDAAHASEDPRRRRRNVELADPEVAPPRPGQHVRDESHERPCQRALARPGRPEHEQDAARIEPERDVAQRRFLSAPIRPAEPARVDCRRRRDLRRDLRGGPRPGGQLDGSPDGNARRAPARRSAAWSSQPPAPATRTPEASIAAATAAWNSGAAAGK